MVGKNIRNYIQYFLCFLFFMLSVVIMLYCYCVALLLFVSSYVLIVCTVPLPPGVNPIAVDKYSKTCLKRTPYIPETWTNGK